MSCNSTRKSPVIFAWFLLAVLLAGCELHHGYYRAMQTSGWTLRHYSGGNKFYFPNKNKSHWAVLISGLHQEAIVVRIMFDDDKFTDRYGSKKNPVQKYYEIWNHVTLSTNYIRLFSENQKAESRFPLGDLGAFSIYGKSINLGGSTNFWLTIPAIKVDEVETPELTTHIEWTDRGYRVEIPLQ